MQYILRAPKELRGEIILPASKSISNRALILNALAKSNLTVENLADCDDTTVLIKGLNSSDKQIDIGAAGTSMRFLTAFLSVQDGCHEITGTERMKNRPIKILVEALKKLGADIEYLEKPGYPPLKISGKKLKGGSIEIDGSISSQYLSALMMAGPCMEKGLTIQVKGALISRPYAEMTLNMMKAYGINAEWNKNIINIPAQSYKAIPFHVESDWSAASYWYEMLSLVPEGELFLEGLTQRSIQGDAKIAKWFESLGVHTEFLEDGVKINKIVANKEMFQADMTDQPDLAQTLVLTCVLKNHPFRLTGLQSLKIKETDRIKALIAECEKLGFLLSETQEDGLEWNGERCMPDYSQGIDTYEDHRMAMAFAPSAFVRNELKINNPDVVSKSYPNFWNDLKSMGFTIKAA